MLTNKELGIYLKKIRKKQSLSLRQVGSQSSISYSHLSMIENGTRKPTALTLKELSNVYNIDYIDLYEKAGYVDFIKSKKLSNIEHTNSYYIKNYGINTEGLTNEDIEEIKKFIEFLRHKKIKLS